MIIMRYYFINTIIIQYSDNKLLIVLLMRYNRITTIIIENNDNY